MILPLQCTDSAWFRNLASRTHRKLTFYRSCKWSRITALRASAAPERKGQQRRAPRSTGALYRGSATLEHVCSDARCVGRPTARAPTIPCEAAGASLAQPFRSSRITVSTDLTLWRPFPTTGTPDLSAERRVPVGHSLLPPVPVATFELAELVCGTRPAMSGLCGLCFLHQRLQGGTLGTTPPSPAPTGGFC